MAAVSLKLKRGESERSNTMLFSSFSSPPSSLSSSGRLKREECKSTLHDSVFSNWQILIGSSDWEDYSLGKDGVQRYMTHNLPNGSSCPGLYELGIASIPNDDGRKSRKHDSEDIIVVYLGQTNNVRTRLQQYGRAGAHLDSGKLASYVNINECSGLFKAIFARGYSIMFRWAPMIDKKKAEKTEAELLGVFDYAWNKCGNGDCRRDEILTKLDTKARKISSFVGKLQLWKHPAFGRKAGINIDASVPLDDETCLLRPHVFKFGKSQIQYIYRNDSVYEDHKVCGVAIDNGHVCKKMPIAGRKRCEEHKGKKIIGTAPVLSGATVTNESTILSGVVLEDGSLCAQLPAYGRCELHTGRRITELELHDVPNVEPCDQKETSASNYHPHLVKGAVKNEEEYNICRAACGDGSMCRNRPARGRKRCEEHKGQRITGTKFELPSMEEIWEKKEDGDTCGVISDGFVCMRKPVSGRKRCEEHKGQRTMSVLPPETRLQGLNKRGNFPVCGVGLGDGSACTRPPVPGRKRCELHKGRRVT